jgi:eukaryotic-like serine/threonine-protein kinase
LHIAKQIAEALEAAHEQGIIHRDFKPGNIKVRPDGTVKVLDFGLAKAMEPMGAMSPSVSQSPTIPSPAMTQAGMILGTAGYMSPEQAKGKPVDRTADVWAFGCVLYEMFTGRPAFDGESVGEILAAVFKQDPDWSRLPAETPPRIRRLLRRCLQKDRHLRWKDIGDARIEIDDSQAEPLATGRRVQPGRWGWSAAAVFAAIAIGRNRACIPRCSGSARDARRNHHTGDHGRDLAGTVA